MTVLPSSPTYRNLRMIVIIMINSSCSVAADFSGNVLYCQQITDITVLLNTGIPMFWSS